MSGRIQWITDVKIIFFFKWLTSFCLSAAMLVKVAPGLAYGFMCINIVLVQLKHSHQGYMEDATVCFERDGSE